MSFRCTLLVIYLDLMHLPCQFFAATHSNAFILPCPIATAQTSSTPPAFIVAVAVVIEIPRMMIAVWNASVHTTAFKPPW